jgi:hypothetical protein
VPSEPVPLGFEQYFYSAIAIAVVFSLIAIVVYRRMVRRNMLSRQAIDPVLPVTTMDRTAVHALPVGPGSDYGMADLRLKIRLILIYSAAIFGLALLAVWIRFFNGSVTLIRGSTMFVMWQALLGSAGALTMSAVLFAAIGIPFLAVLLAWDWCRAAAAFVVYVGVWAALAFTIVTVFHGWNWANGAIVLIAAQLAFIGFYAPDPFLLLLLTGNRRVRSVFPMTLAGSFVFCGIILGMSSLTAEVYRLQLLPNRMLTLLGHSRALFLIEGLMAVFVSWWLLRLLATLYEKKGLVRGICG